MNTLKSFTIATLFSFNICTAYADCSNEIPRYKPDVIYKDYGDGTVMDTKTRLVWQKCSMGQTYSGGTCIGTATSYTWDQISAAVQDANNSNLHGQNDWRAPNIRELFSLADMACKNPAINSTLFPNTVANAYYWSSTATPFDSFNTRAVAMVSNNGALSSRTKTSSLYLRLVRNSN